MEAMKTPNTIVLVSIIAIMILAFSPIALVGCFLVIILAAVGITFHLIQPRPTIGRNARGQFTRIN